MKYKNCSRLGNIALLFIVACVTIPKIKALEEPPPLYDDEMVFWEQHDNGTFVQVAIGDNYSTQADVDVTKIKFFLSTSENPDLEKEYHGPSFGKYNFTPYVIPHVKTYFICHGYTGSHRDGPAPAIIPGLLRQNTSVNIFNIDWEGVQYLGPIYWYWTAVSATRNVGEMTAKLIMSLVRSNLIGLKDVHFIGHSLGGHVGGFTGKNILPFGSIGRITGLDPAGFWFEDNDPADRLDVNDAHYVDVIHTATFLTQYLIRKGYKDPLGDVDFYPNGGLNQPGCGEDLDAVCSHARSYEYFAESTGFNLYSFPAWKCGNWSDFLDGKCGANERIHIGLHVPNGSSGAYYLQTGGKPLYAKVPGKDITVNQHAPPTAEMLRIRDVELALHSFERIVIDKENIRDRFRFGQLSHVPLEFYLKTVNKIHDRVLQTFALKELQILRQDGSIPFNVYSACLVFNNKPLQGLKHAVPPQLAAIFSSAVAITMEGDHRALNITSVARGTAGKLITSSFTTTREPRRLWQIKPLLLENNCWFTITNIERNLSMGVDSRNGSNVAFKYWTSGAKKDKSFLWKILGSTTRGNGEGFVIKSAQTGWALDTMDDGGVYLQNKFRPPLWKFV